MWSLPQGANSIWVAAAAAKSRQLGPTLCNPIDGSPPGSPVPGILQARTLEWVAISFSNVWKWKVKVKLLTFRLLATHGIFQARVLEWGAIAVSQSIKYKAGWAKGQRSSKYKEGSPWWGFEGRVAGRTVSCQDRNGSGKAQLWEQDPCPGTKSVTWNHLSMQTSAGDGSFWKFKVLY